MLDTISNFCADVDQALAAARELLSAEKQTRARESLNV